MAKRLFSILGLFAFLGLFVPLPAAAQLPPAAYAGDFWSRVTGGFSCVSFKQDRTVLPKVFFGNGWAKAGSYVYYDGNTKSCVFVDNPNGPQL